MNRGEAEALKRAIMAARPGINVTVDPRPGGAVVAISGTHPAASAARDMAATEFRVSDDGPLLRFLVHGSVVPPGGNVISLIERRKLKS